MLGPIGSWRRCLFSTFQRILNRPNQSGGDPFPTEVFFRDAKRCSFGSGEPLRTIKPIIQALRHQSRTSGRVNTYCLTRLSCDFR